MDNSIIIKVKMKEISEEKAKQSYQKYREENPTKNNKIVFMKNNMSTL